MRILWFTNDLEPGIARALGMHASVSGGWMWALAERLCTRKDTVVALATAVPGVMKNRLQQESIAQYLIPQRNGQHAFAHTEADLKQAVDIVRDFQPDVIHVHGTERFYGLLRQTLDPKIPIVISIQGLLSRYCPFIFADMSLPEKFATMRLRDLLRGKGPVFHYKCWQDASRREAMVLETNRYFIGRTEWDRSWVMAHNSSARYYFCNEALREPFFEERWDLSKIRRNSILFTSAQNPLKGVYTLLDAIAILRRWQVPVTLQLAGDWIPRGEWGRPVVRRISRLGLNESVEFLGALDAPSLAKHMSTAHLFVSPSHIENSSNSVMEAMAVGLPCVASFVGGLTTILQSGKLGLAVPPGDAAMLASAVQRLLSDDELAVSLSHSAREVAHTRNDSVAITERQLEIYSDVIEDARCGSQN